MALMDIMGLYPSIPLKKAQEVIAEILQAEDTQSSRTDWKVDGRIKLLQIRKETYFKTLDGKIWVQFDGCTITKLISGDIAEIYRKETRTQKYIHWKLNHFQAVKLGV